MNDYAKQKQKRVERMKAGDFSEGEIRILRVVKSSPLGENIINIANRAAVSFKLAEHVLTSMREAGLVSNNGARGVCGRWCMPGMEEQSFAAAREAHYGQKGKKRDLKKEAKRLKERRERQAKSAVPLPERPMVRIVPASSAKPLRPTGPVSVFQLGAL